MSTLKYKYNCKLGVVDHRDFLFALKATPYSGVLPSKVDLTEFCSPVTAQGKIGSCTAQAVASLFEFEQLEQFRITQNTGATLFEGEYSTVSRLFIYYYERVLQGTVDEDSGAEIRDGIKVLSHQGVCREVSWEYLDSNLYLKPDDAAYAEASQHKIRQYLRLQSFLDMKHCLAAGRPFAFGMMAPEELESEEVAKTGLLHNPTSATQFLGGHAVVCVGYDDSTRRVKIRNSWGADWGDKGYFTMPYEFIANPQYCMDFWTLIK